MRKIKWLLLPLFFVCCSAFAASPQQMMQSTSDQVIAALKQNQASLKSNPKIVYQIVTSILAPRFEIQGMSRAVLGRDVWTKATPQQRTQFSQQFKNLLIRTYSSALASYQNETVQYLPNRSAASGNRAQVSTVIVRHGAPSISVNYRLVQMGSDWKIYDFSVDGISMLESYRTQFSSVIGQSGLDGLINKLSQRS